MAEQIQALGQNRILQALFRDAVSAGLGALAVKVREKALENKQIRDIYSDVKEWGDFLLGAGVIAVYEALAPRLGRGINTGYIPRAVHAIGAILMYRSFSVLLGEPFVIVTKDGKLYVKNIDPLPDDGYELVFRQAATVVKAKADASGNITPEQSISEGAWDVAVLGAGKASYSHQLVPAIAAQTA